MTKWMRLGQCAVLACAVAATAGWMRGDDQGVEWLGSYREGLRQAKATNKPLLVEFRCEA